MGGYSPIFLSTHWVPLQLLRNNLRNHCSGDSSCPKGRSVPSANVTGQPDTEEAHGLFSILMAWSPHKMADAPTPVDACSLLLLLSAVALAAGDHPS